MLDERNLRTRNMHNRQTYFAMELYFDSEANWYYPDEDSVINKVTAIVTIGKLGKTGYK